MGGGAGSRERSRLRRGSDDAGSIASLESLGSVDSLDSTGDALGLGGRGGSGAAAAAITSRLNAERKRAAAAARASGVDLTRGMVSRPEEGGSAGQAGNGTVDTK